MRQLFSNTSGLEFKDISTEEFREYGFPNGTKLVINGPLYLNVSPNGGHRIFDSEGVSWYVSPKESWWIKWVAREGEPNFVK